MGAIAGEELKKMEKTQVHVAREEKILVLVRLRPLNEKEILANEAADWECINDTTVLYRNTLREGSTFPSAYSFDRVYRGECPTRQVYEDGPKEVALSVVKGINSSIFAYGQTSSGKTYTMSGITEFAVADIFDYIFKHEDRAFVVKFSAIEIYNEAIRDLLSPDSTPLRLRDDPEKGAAVEKATEETLRDWNHLKELISVCEAQRKIGETSLNERSSRSHQIIKLTVESSAREFLGKENSTTLMASVNFIDLAGSERASQALSAGARLKEGCHINRSLLTLGTVIRKLSNGRQGHINYRDSKLTRILQPCLGGNARTAIVCTLSPARSHVEQTRNTLLFACCAKEVTTKAQINVVMSDKALVKQLQRELARLESELRNPAPATSSCDCGVTLRKKDLQIQKMEKQLAEMTKQRDIAQSRLEDFMKMVEHDASSKAGTPHFRNRTNKWEDGSVSEISGVVDPDRTSFISDGTSTPLSTARAHVRSHSDDDLEEEMSPRHSGDQSEEYCKEVQCIEMEESTRDINNDSEERTDAETLLGHNAEANGETGSAQHRIPSSVRSVRRRKSWSRGDTMTGTSTPPDALETDYRGRPEGHGFAFPDLEFGSGGKLLRNDSMTSRGSDSTEAHSIGTPLVGEEGGITSIRSFVEGLKEMVSDPENSGKMRKDIGVDAMEEEVSGTMTNWSEEFERQREQILGLWQTCHVSLVHRTYFFLLFTGDQADSIYIGVELRRLSFMKESFSQGNHAFERGQTLTIASSLKALHRERRMLSKLVGKRFTGEDRIVNGLLKTALGPPTGSSTTLSPAQDSTFRNDSVKCLVNLAKAMGNWMDQQLKVNETVWPKGSQVYASMDSNASQISELEGTISDCDSQPDTSNPEAYDASMLEQRRAYKIELQKGISLFNRKPSKGVEFLISTKKIGSSPEEVASFLMKTAGLNGTVIGDYLGERDELPLKVMHAYVDSFNFEKKDFVEAIRFFLRGFRLPGEAQKIDRIMEKFAEHYWKCNPGSFTSADTAYVLAYSVIMLNTDAHNNMVKDKMTKADFVRNNRGIDDGKDLPEEYLGSLYDRVVKEEIRMNSDTLAPQNKQVNGLNKLLGLDGILNLVSWMQPDEKPHGANGRLIRDIQEQFQAKPEKSESVYHTVTDISILRFILEVSWGPMLAAFSVTIDQSDDRLATSLCLQGFRYAVHVTAVMGMQTQRDAFVTSMAKFTNLHCAADMKQKNVDAVKAIITIAIEDGNHLHGSWEHILTCLSRIEHLQLLGEVSPSEKRYVPTKKAEVDDKKALGFPNLKKRGSFQNPSVMAVVRGGSYDSTSLVKSVPKLVTPEQIKSFIANLNLLDQIGNFELNHVYANSQRLNSEAIVSFVKALCKVSMSELQSPTDPRVFSLTKLVETAHYNMNRIRLVWSRIWNVLSDFFVSVGLSENLSVAIFVMDSLRQLSMKFLEREELANYHFQHEFLRPFVVVMQKSSSAEIRELIVRCVSQMVLSRVSNVKSGWKNVFTVFTTAALDERKNIVLLAFETIEKIVRDHFHCIIETEITVYADCIRCLITFTNSKFEGDIGFNTIEFLRFCALKLEEGGLVLNEKLKNNTISALKEDFSDTQSFTDLDEQVSYWIPLLTGLCKQVSDPRPAIRKRSIEVLFHILMDHGHLFTRPFWTGIFSSIILPVFNNIRSKTDMLFEESVDSPSSASLDTEETTWDVETSTLALQLLVDLLVKFFRSVRSQLPSVVSIIVGFIKSPFQGSTGSGISVLLHLADGLARSASEDEWREIFLALKEAASLTFAGFMKVLRTMDDIEDVETLSGQSVNIGDLDDDSLHIMSYVVSRTKKHIDVLSQIVEVVSDLYRRNQFSLSASHVDILADIFSCIASHAQQLNTDTVLRRKFKRACSVQNLTEPQLLNFENEAYKSYMMFLQDMVTCNPNVSKELDLESRLVTECAKIVKIYLKCTDPQQQEQQQRKPVLWVLPMESDRVEEATARTSLLVSSLEALCSLEAESLKKHVSSFFPLLVDLVRTEHCSPQVPYVLSNVLKSCIGPILA